MTEETIKDHNDKCETAKAEVPERGDWNDEPNRLNWSHAGLDCMLVRHTSLLHWCGYVGVRSGHPAFGKGYDEVQLGIYDYEKREYTTPAVFPDLDVHYGLTFADRCGGYICHTGDDPKDETWWLGFDCAHSGDLSPGSLRLGDRFRIWDDTYKTMAQVKRWTERLAGQLASVT